MFGGVRIIALATFPLPIIHDKFIASRKREHKSDVFVVCAIDSLRNINRFNYSRLEPAILLI